MTIWLWSAFLGLIGALVLIDLGLTTRRPHAVGPADALPSFALWILTALSFSFALGYVYQTNLFELQSQVSFPVDRRAIDGRSAWLQFLTAYALELSLSLDNIAVLALLIRYFRVPAPLVPRLLFWSMLFAISARWLAITVCSRLLRDFWWMTPALGAVLILAMLRVLVMPTERTDFGQRRSVRFARALVRARSPHPDQHLFVRDGGRWAAAPMLLFVIAACALDLTYAADSIPALFAVTKDPFIAFTASAFAVLALRSFYLALADVVARFRFLRVALVLLLAYVAIKMFKDSYLPKPTEVTLAVITGLMLLALAASALFTRLFPRATPAPATPPTPLEDLSEAVAATRRNFRKVVILIAGTFVIVLGLVIAPLPGPGPTILVPIGLALLATEFIWARRLLDRLKTHAFNLSDRADALVARTSIWIIPATLAAYWGVALGVLHAWLGLRWHVIAVIAGGPFIPFAIWAFTYLRKRARGRRPP